MAKSKAQRHRDIAAAALRDLKKALGAKNPDKGHTALAKFFRVRPQSSIKWKALPVEHVLKAERKTGISRYRLRPDIYGELPPEAPANA